MGLKNFVIFSLLILISPFSQGSILFEGYSKVISGKVQVGYIIQRYEFNEASQQFRSIYYLSTNALGGSITESLVASATSSLKPIAYQYTSIAGKKVKTIDARFTKNTMEGTITEGGKTSQISRPLKKGTFLSTFLVYLMMRGKDGFKTGTKYDYSAIAEEDGQIYRGSAFVKGTADFMGQTVYRVFNRFKSAKFISMVTHQGEVLSTRSPAVSILTTLVKTPAEATKNFDFNTKRLKLVFGNVPIGSKNVLSARKEKMKTLKRPSPTKKPPGKKSGIPGGKGIIIKGKKSGK